MAEGTGGWNAGAYGDDGWNDGIVLSETGIAATLALGSEIASGGALINQVGLTCFDLCDILKLKLTTYYEYPINAHVMNDGSGDFYGCICK